MKLTLSVTIYLGSEKNLKQPDLFAIFLISLVKGNQPPFRGWHMSSIDFNYEQILSIMEVLKAIRIFIKT